MSPPSNGHSGDEPDPEVEGVEALMALRNQASPRPSVTGGSGHRISLPVAHGRVSNARHSRTTSRMAQSRTYQDTIHMTQAQGGNGGEEHPPAENTDPTHHVELEMGNNAWMFSTLDHQMREFERTSESLKGSEVPVLKGLNSFGDALARNNEDVKEILDVHHRMNAAFCGPGRTPHYSSGGNESRAMGVPNAGSKNERHDLAASHLQEVDWLVEGQVEEAQHQPSGEQPTNDVENTAAYAPSPHGYPEHSLAAHSAHSHPQVAANSLNPQTRSFYAHQGIPYPGVLHQLYATYVSPPQQQLVAHSANMQQQPTGYPVSVLQTPAVQYELVDQPLVAYSTSAQQAPAVFPGIPPPQASGVIDPESPVKRTRNNWTQEEIEIFDGAFNEMEGQEDKEIVPEIVERIWKTLKKIRSFAQVKGRAKNMRKAGKMPPAFSKKK